MGRTHAADQVAETPCTVSIIIPNWNGGSVLQECLDSILEHTRGVDFELILVDNGSTDESRRTIEGLADRDSRVRVILNEENLFFARACNQGYEISRGRYLLIANNDILLSDDAVSGLVDYADRHPEIGVVSPCFTGRDGQPQEFVRRLPGALDIIAHYHRLGRAVDRFLLGRRLQNRYFYRDRSFDQVEEIEQAGASFSLFRRDEIDRLDRFFDEAFPLLFNDVDLYLRLKKNGVVSHVVPEIRVVHLAGVSSEKLDPERYLDFQYGAIFDYFGRHHPLQAPLLWLAWPRRRIRHR